MEAEKRSGTSAGSDGPASTARCALEQKKLLACYVPESGWVSSGCRHLTENHNANPPRNMADLELFLETLPNEPKRKGGGGWHV